MPDAQEPEVTGLLPLTADGAAGKDPHGDSTSHAWQVLLDAQIRLEEAATGLRQNLMLTAGVLVLATMILERFLFLTQPETVLISLLPALLLIAGGAVDLLWYDRRVRRFGETIRRLEQDHPDTEHLQATREDAQGRTFPRLGLTLFYAVPTVVFLAVAAWRFL